MWVGDNVGCTMDFLMAHSAWQIDQFPTRCPMNGLFVHWSRGWGMLSFFERLVIFYHITILVYCNENITKVGSLVQVMTCRLLRAKSRPECPTHNQCSPNSLDAELFWKLLKMYLHFVWYLGLWSTEENQIHNGATLHVACAILSIPCLLMLWRL